MLFCVFVLHCRLCFAQGSLLYVTEAIHDNAISLQFVLTCLLGYVAVILFFLRVYRVFLLCGRMIMNVGFMEHRESLDETAAGRLLVCRDWLSSVELVCYRLLRLILHSCGTSRHEN
jgi:hypothetical protein